MPYKLKDDEKPRSGAERQKRSRDRQAVKFSKWRSALELILSVGTISEAQKIAQEALGNKS